MVKEAELPTRSRWLKKLSNPPGQGGYHANSANAAKPLDINESFTLDLDRKKKIYH